MKDSSARRPESVVKTRKRKLKALSLFCSAGIGDLGVQAAGIQIILANELLPSRVDLYRENFRNPIVEGDIQAVKQILIQQAKQSLGSEELFLLFATPPCQGMSSNGMGKLKAEISAGRRLDEDARNRLIIPALDIAVALQPRWLLLENVPGMERTEIRTAPDVYENIIIYARRRLGPEYDGVAEVVACEDYGIPQRRKRLITIFTRDPLAISYLRANKNSFFTKEMREERVTLANVISKFPALEARPGENSRTDFHQYHYVPIISELKRGWLQSTREGDTAFNNQCVNADCLSQRNPGHQDLKVDGRWVSSKEIPIYCVDCGSLLPRPHVVENGRPRLLKGFHSAYRRMRWDEPARTVTQNFIYEASDNKIHPTQNRVLSVYEAMVVQTISKYDYKFSIDGTDISTAKIAEVIGESVPPHLIQKICTMMLRCSEERTTQASPAKDDMETSFRLI